MAKMAETYANKRETVKKQQKFFRSPFYKMLVAIHQNFVLTILNSFSKRSIVPVEKVRVPIFLTI